MPSAHTAFAALLTMLSVMAVAAFFDMLGSPSATLPLLAAGLAVSATLIYFSAAMWVEALRKRKD